MKSLKTRHAKWANLLHALHRSPIFVGCLRSFILYNVQDEWYDGVPAEPGQEGALGPQQEAAAVHQLDTYTPLHVIHHQTLAEVISATCVQIS